MARKTNTNTPAKPVPPLHRKAIRFDPGLGACTRASISMLAAQFLHLYEASWVKGDLELAREVLRTAAGLRGANVVDFDPLVEADREQAIHVLILWDEMSPNGSYQRIMDGMK